MTTQKIIGVLLLIAGSALLFFGYQESQGVGEQVLETFSGHFTDATTWYFIAGGAAAVFGLILLRTRFGGRG